MRKRDVLLHHPFQSFEPVIDLLRTSAEDPQVVAIKMTVYRTGTDSVLMEHLLRAAQKGKEVTVVVELMARFDEEANIGWASRLEDAGAHVVYGVVGYKTHAKLLLIVRREDEGLRRYVHMGTGNYPPAHDPLLHRFRPDVGEPGDRQRRQRSVQTADRPGPGAHLEAPVAVALHTANRTSSRRSTRKPNTHARAARAGSSRR